MSRKVSFSIMFPDTTSTSRRIVKVYVDEDFVGEIVSNLPYDNPACRWTLTRELGKTLWKDDPYPTTKYSNLAVVKQALVDRVREMDEGQADG